MSCVKINFQKYIKCITKDFAFCFKKFLTLLSYTIFNMKNQKKQ